jgi:hypothetical protein
MHLPTRRPVGNSSGAMVLGTPWEKREMDNATPTNRHGRDSRPRRDDPDDDDHHRGTRRHRNSPCWSRASHYRGAIDDCYNTTRYRGGNYSHSSYHSRRLSLAST